MEYQERQIYNIPSTGLRFFTVYGPAGRPDMAYFGFTNKLKNNDIIHFLHITAQKSMILCTITIKMKHEVFMDGLVGVVDCWLVWE